MYIGIDCGTQGTKAVLWHEGRVLNTAYSPHHLMQDCSGRREQSAIWWYEAMIASIHAMFVGFEEYKKEIKGIGISGQQHGLVLLDKNSEVICDSLLWCDTRPQQVLKEFEKINNLELSTLVGIEVPVAFTIAKLLWVKRNNPAAFRQIKYIMLPHEYLNYRLTHRYVVEPGDASGTGWFDTRTKSFSGKVFALLDLPQQFELPSIIKSDEVLGRVLPSISEELGINSDVIVSSGGGDNMMAAIGTGNVDSGVLTISLGTSGTAFSHSKHQVDTDLFPDINAFCSSTNGYLPLVSTMNVTTANNQILKLVGKDIAAFDELVGSAGIGAGGLKSVPFYNGARLPNAPAAKGALFGMNADNTSQQNLMRATVEAVTFNLTRGINILLEAGVDIGKVCVIGGGANSKVWRQMISDVTNLKLYAPTLTEAAAIGAAIQAFWAAENDKGNRIEIGQICQEFVRFNPQMTTEPDESNHKKYAALLPEYNELVDWYLGSGYSH